MKDKDKVKVEADLLEFVHKIQKDIADTIPVIPICAEHCRGGQMFRSHPNFLGKGPWRDWVMVRWTTGELPAKIWGFLDLSAIPEGIEIPLSVGKSSVEKGIYAIIESADFIVEEENPGPTDITSDLFTEILLETKGLTDDGEVIERRFYLADVESFVGPLVVIPNVGCKPKCKYFVMTPKAEWSEQFARWIEMDHKDDAMEMATTDPDVSDATGHELGSSDSENS
jgi:hypothetical protein